MIINYPKLREPAIIITLLHIVILLMFLYLNISTLYYSIFFFTFSVFIMSQIIQYNSSNPNKLNKVAAVVIILLSAVYFLLISYYKNIYLNYIWTAFLIVLGIYAVTKTIKNNTKTPNSEKNKDYFLFYLLTATFIFTLFINNYQTYLLVKPF